MSQSTSILTSYGWDPEIFLSEPMGDFIPARVLSVYGEYFKIITYLGERKGISSGTLLSTGESPVTGDWVFVREINGDDLCIIEKILPRKTFLRRANPGKRNQIQAIAANIDLLIIVMGLDYDYSPRRIERYLYLAKISGAEVAIVLNKRDLCENSETKFSEIQKIAGSVPIWMMSALDDAQTKGLMECIKPGKTIAFLGSSGAGKSTIINSLLGAEVQKTNTLKVSDGTGRHTTTNRELFLLPQGGILMDNPGIREVGLFSSENENEIELIFPEITSAATECRFRDCSHLEEPGCAVQKAIEDGKIEQNRFASYQKLLKELNASEVLKNPIEAQKKKQKDKQMAKDIRSRLKDKGRR